MTPTSEIRIKLFSGKQVGQHPGIKLKQATKCSDSFVPKVGGSTSPEWWVNINRNGGSTWFGIYKFTFKNKYSFFERRDSLFKIKNSLKKINVRSFERRNWLFERRD